MYKVLVTSSRCDAGVHTLVLEFVVEAEALTAIKRINDPEQIGKLCCSQHAVKLW